MKVRLSSCYHLSEVLQEQNVLNCLRNLYIMNYSLNDMIIKKKPVRNRRTGKIKRTTYNKTPKHTNYEKSVQSGNPSSI